MLLDEIRSQYLEILELIPEEVRAEAIDALALRFSGGQTIPEGDDEVKAKAIADAMARSLYDMLVEAIFALRTKDAKPSIRAILESEVAHG